jgi:hypothetical protein
MAIELVGLALDRWLGAQEGESVEESEPIERFAELLCGETHLVHEIRAALGNVATARLAISHGHPSVAWGRELLAFRIPIPVRCSVFVFFSSLDADGMNARPLPSSRPAGPP